MEKNYTWPNIYKGLKIMAQYWQRIKTFLALEQSRFRKSGGTLTSNRQVEARRDCSRLGNALSLCSAARPSEPPKLCRSAAPRTRALNLQSKPSIVFWNSLREWLPDEAGAQTWTVTWTLPPDQRVVKVLGSFICSETLEKVCEV